MQRTRSIVFLTGGTEWPDGAFRRALAVARSTNAPLTVVRERPDPADAAVPAAWTSSDDRITSVARAEGVDVAVQDCARGEMVAALCRAVPDTPSLLIKVDDRSGEGRRHLDCEDDRRLLRSLPCTVWLMPHGTSGPARVILAAVELPADETDGTDRAVLRAALALARLEGAELHVVHAWSFIGESILSCPTRGVGPARAKRILKQVREVHGARLAVLLAEEPEARDARLVLEKGNPSTVIREVARRIGADVLVAGYRGRRGFWGLVQGNLVEGFLGVSGLSMLAVRTGSPLEPIVGGLDAA